MIKKRKSQMEIMGLAIVVVLIVLGMLFAVRFFINREPAEFKSRFTHKQLAQNIVTAFLNTKTESCHGMSVTELLQDCGQSMSVICEDGTTGSCEYVRDTAGLILSQTLEQWKVDYNFKVYFSDDAANPIFTLDRHASLGCTGESEPGWGYTPASTRTIYTRLDVCS